MGEPTSHDADFVRALDFNLDHEGRVYEDVAGDAGGPTKWGITWTDYNRWRTEHGLAPLSVAEARATRLAGLTEPIIRDIYFTRYWLPMKGAALPSPLDHALFDCAVNTGCAQSVKFLQRILGVEDDGIFGAGTLEATRRYIAAHGQGKLLDALLTRREDFYRAIAQRGANRKFLKGWLSRVADLGRAIKGALTA